MNWKKIFRIVRRMLIHNKRILVFLLIMALATVLAVNVDNYLGADFPVLYFLAFGTVFLELTMFACWIFPEFDSKFSPKRGLVMELMLPALPEEKFWAKIAVAVVLPVAIAWATCFAIRQGDAGTFYAHQVSVENTAENMERYDPESISCTNFLLGFTETYKADTAYTVFKGHFGDVLLHKEYTPDIKVGVSSSVPGDLMILIFVYGWMFFACTVFSGGQKPFGQLLGIMLPILLLILLLPAMDLVLRAFGSVAAAENFILIASVALGLAGVLFFWLSLRLSRSQQYINKLN